jgi:hypothetical protein
MSDADLSILKEFRANLNEARDVVLRLRKRLASVEAMYRERQADVQDLVAALNLIADNGGKTLYDNSPEGVPPVSCNGQWCAEQAHSALDAFRSKPVQTFTLID